ncbi:MAG: hypothetical protein JO199_12780, partial [Candidatus Eremiobacteraeota bacterium]|nr:hypothetical protein [Candidatus Eremiobacteraeota bacterium]
MRTLIGTLVIVLFLATPTASPAQGTAPSPPVAPSQASAIEVARDRLDAMLRTGHADPTWFADSFLAQVPASKIDEIVASLTGALGTYERIEFAQTRFVAHFASGTDDILIRLDGDDKIVGLFFKQAVRSAASLDEALHALGQMTGSVSYTILEANGAEKAGLNATTPMAVGSAFKLAVLNALVERIGKGTRHWNDVVELDDRWK